MAGAGEGPTYEDRGDAPVREVGREGGRSSVMAIALGERGYELTWLEEEKDQHTKKEEMPR